MAGDDETAVVDSASEYYINHSDIPNSKKNHSDIPKFSLTTECLVGENFNSWQRAVEFSLIARNKLSFQWKVS